MNFHRLGAPNSPAPVTRIGQARRTTNSVNFHRLGAPNSPAPRCSFSKNTLGKTKNPDRREHCCRIQFGWELRVRLGPPLFDTRRKPKLAFSLLSFFSFLFSLPNGDCPLEGCFLPRLTTRVLFLPGPQHHPRALPQISPGEMSRLWQT